MTRESLSGTREEFISVGSPRVLEGLPMGIMIPAERFYTRQRNGRTERRKGFSKPDKLMTGITEINDDNFDAEVSGSDAPVGG